MKPGRKQQELKSASGTGANKKIIPDIYDRQAVGPLNPGNSNLDPPQSLFQESGIESIYGNGGPTSYLSRGLSQ